MGLDAFEVTSLVTGIVSVLSSVVVLALAVARYVKRLKPFEEEQKETIRFSRTWYLVLSVVLAAASTAGLTGTVIGIATKDEEASI